MVPVAFSGPHAEALRCSGAKTNPTAAPSSQTVRDLSDKRRAVTRLFHAPLMEVSFLSGISILTSSAHIILFIFTVTLKILIMKSKRSRAPTSPIEVANRKTDEQFIADYLQPGTAKESFWVTAWTHPKIGAKYGIGLVQPANLKQEDLDACFDLLMKTSKKDYENSAGRWHPDRKLKEMKSPELRYVLVKEEETGELHGFTSLMPTYEEGQPVVYCYEIHLKPVLQGTGLGSLLMSFHTTVALNLPPITKVMLTCFLSNPRGLTFYKKLGFERDDISPVPRILRGKMINPDYVIMSKRIRLDPTTE